MTVGRAPLPSTFAPSDPRSPTSGRSAVRSEGRGRAGPDCRRLVDPGVQRTAARHGVDTALHDSTVLPLRAAEVRRTGEHAERAGNGAPLRPPQPCCLGDLRGARPRPRARPRLHARRGNVAVRRGPGPQDVLGADPQRLPAGTAGGVRPDAAVAHERRDPRNTQHRRPGHPRERPASRCMVSNRPPPNGTVGNNVYNTPGAHQTRRQNGRRQETRIFHIRVFNDGNAQTGFTLRGTGAGRDASVRYPSAQPTSPRRCAHTRASGSRSRPAPSRSTCRSG